MLALVEEEPEHQVERLAVVGRAGLGVAVEERRSQHLKHYGGLSIARITAVAQPRLPGDEIAGPEGVASLERLVTLDQRLGERVQRRVERVVVEQQRRGLQVAETDPVEQRTGREGVFLPGFHGGVSIGCDDGIRPRRCVTRCRTQADNGGTATTWKFSPDDAEAP